MKTFITDTDREKHIPIRVFEDGAANNQILCLQFQYCS